MIGVFGGTFDPPHRGHLRLAESGRQELGLAYVLWVVTADPPHKPDRPVSPVEDRLAMVARLLAGREGHRISRVEIDRPGPHFAVDTMGLLREQFPGEEWVYLMGADSLRDLPHWRQPHQFVDRCTAIGVLGRGPGVDWDGLERAIPGLRSKVQCIAVGEMDVSSSAIRGMVKRGRRIEQAVTAPVAAYIAAQGLYKS